MEAGLERASSQREWQELARVRAQIRSLDQMAFGLQHDPKYIPYSCFCRVL